VVYGVESKDRGKRIWLILTGVFRFRCCLHSMMSRKKQLKLMIRRLSLSGFLQEVTKNQKWRQPAAHTAISCHVCWWAQKALRAASQAACIRDKCTDKTPPGTTAVTINAAVWTPKWDSTSAMTNASHGTCRPCAHWKSLRPACAARRRTAQATSTSTTLPATRRSEHAVSSYTRRTAHETLNITHVLRCASWKEVNETHDIEHQNYSVASFLRHVWLLIYFCCIYNIVA